MVSTNLSKENNNWALNKKYYFSTPTSYSHSADKSKIPSEVNKNSYKNGKTPETTYFPDESILSVGKTPF